MKDYEQIFFDFVTKLHNNLQYCLVIGSEVCWVGYKFVNGVNIETEHFYYDGYYGIDFIFDGYRIFIMEDSFYFIDLDEESKNTEHMAIDVCYDGETNIVDKDTYFQYYTTHDLKGLRWEIFSMIKDIRETFFEEYYTRTYLENGFKFIV